MTFQVRNVFVSRSADEAVKSCERKEKCEGNEEKKRKEEKNKKKERSVDGKEQKDENLPVYFINSMRIFREIFLVVKTILKKAA